MIPHALSSSNPSRKLGWPSEAAFARNAASFQQAKTCGPPVQAVSVAVASAGAAGSATAR